MTFEGKVVAVTGAGGGIGTAIVSKFVDLGAKAVLLDVKEEFAKRTADLLHLTEENSMCLGVDVSKEEDVKEAVSKIRTRFNRVDVLVNTAGIPGPSARTEDYSFEDIKKVYEVNVFGTFLMMQIYFRSCRNKKVVQLSILDLYQECLGIHMKSVMVQARQRLFI